MTSMLSNDMQFGTRTMPDRITAAEVGELR